MIRGTRPLQTSLQTASYLKPEVVVKYIIYIHAYIQSVSYKNLHVQGMCVKLREIFNSVEERCS